MPNHNGLLLYNKESIKSAKNLAYNLNLYPIHKDESILKLSKIYPIKIRYGNSYFEQIEDTKYNSPETIALCSNSKKFSNFCMHNNIFSPQYSPILNMQNEPEYPFLLRRNYHRSGRDIVIINSQQDLQQFTIEQLILRFYVKYIPTEYEIRLHYILGNIEKIFLKQPGPFADTNIPIRSTSHGWHYSIRPNDDEHRFVKAKELALQIAEKINLQFGAFDMAWSKINKQYILWEINTAPGLNEQTLQLYTERLKNIL